MQLKYIKIKIMGKRKNTKNSAIFIKKLYSAKVLKTLIIA